MESDYLKRILGEVIVDKKAIQDSRKVYVEKLMNEENEWDHRISAGVKEGPENCIRIDEVAASWISLSPKQQHHRTEGNTMH